MTTAEWINDQAGKWCSWEEAVYIGGVAVGRPVYGIILPDHEAARDHGVFSVLELEPGAVTYDSYLDPEGVTILDDVPRAFPAGYSSLNHPTKEDE